MRGDKAIAIAGNGQYRHPTKAAGTTTATWVQAHRGRRHRPALATKNQKFFAAGLRLDRRFARGALAGPLQSTAQQAHRGTRQCQTQVSSRICLSCHCPSILHEHRCGVCCVSLAAGPFFLWRISARKAAALLAGRRCSTNAQLTAVDRRARSSCSAAQM